MRKLSPIIVIIIVFISFILNINLISENSLVARAETGWSEAIRLSDWENESVEPSITAYGNNMHVVWSDDKTGNFEIYYRRSLNNGVTWDNEIRLTNTMDDQTHPKIDVWENNVHVIWNKGYVNSTDNGESWGTPVNPFPMDNLTAYPDLYVYQDKVYFVVGNYSVKLYGPPSTAEYWYSVIFKEFSWANWVFFEYNKYTIAVEVAITGKNNSIHVIYGWTTTSWVRVINHTYSLNGGLPGSWSNSQVIVEGMQKMGISIGYDQDIVRMAWSDWTGSEDPMGTNTKSWDGTWSNNVYVGGLYGMTAVSGYYITWSEADLNNVGSNIDGIILTSSGNPNFDWHDVHLENGVVHLVYIDNYEIHYMRKITTPSPSPPNNLNANLNGNDIALLWNASNDDGGGNNNVIGYAVYRSNTGLNGSYEFSAWIEANGSSSYSWIDYGSGDGDPNNYFYIVRANDTLNNEEQNEIKVGKVIIQLDEGWNIFSVSLIQSNNSRELVLQTLFGNYSALQGYHAGRSEPWVHWHEDKPNYFNDEISIVIENGYYIDMRNPDVLVVAGAVPTSIHMPLKSGWNLVGYPSFTSHNRTIGLNNIEFGTQINAIQWFDSYTKTWHFLNEGDAFEIGRGYWIHATTDYIWEVPL